MSDNPTDQIDYRILIAIIIHVLFVCVLIQMNIYHFLMMGHRWCLETAYKALTT